MQQLEKNSSAFWSCIWKMVLRVLLAWLFEWKVFAAEPSFRVPPDNVTVIEGDTAILRCSILHLTENHNIIWTDAAGNVLTLDEKRIHDDQRFSVERPHKHFWNLYIREVQYADGGKYICQINTTPVKMKEVVLNVEVPPYIIEEDSSGDKTVREGDTVKLLCNATGIPLPEITWYKTYNSASRPRERIGSQGEQLKIHNVSRDCGGAYICVADNGVGEPADRKMIITVNYHPEVQLQQARLGQYPGKETFLLCEVTAHPHGVMFWEKKGRQLTGSDKYSIDISNSDEEHKKILSLRIKKIEFDDFGRYTCKAENFIGTDKESLILYDYSEHLPKTTTTFTPVQPSPKNEYKRPKEVIQGRPRPTQSSWSGEKVGRSSSAARCALCSTHTFVVIFLVMVYLRVTAVDFIFAS